MLGIKFPARQNRPTQRDKHLSQCKTKSPFMADMLVIYDCVYPNSIVYTYATLIISRLETLYK